MEMAHDYGFKPKEIKRPGIMVSQYGNGRKIDTKKYVDIKFLAYLKQILPVVITDSFLFSLHLSPGGALS